MTSTRAERANGLAVFPVLTALCVLSLLGGLVYPGLFLVLAIAVVVGLMQRAQMGGEFVAVMGPFRSLGYLLGTADRLARCGVETIAIRRIRRQQAELHALAEKLGGLEAALSIASLRAGTDVWTRPEFTAGAEWLAEDLSHPLVPGCVTNSLRLSPSRGMLLTGANMTGKSTLLRSVGVNVIAAQSLCVVFARSYRAPWLALRTCISPSDDLLEGKSLYQREAEVVVAILAQAAQAAHAGPMLCLFDEMFRGTNTTDRVAASAAVLRHLVRPSSGANEGAGCLVIAATHDLELVPLLADVFEAFHMGDRMDASGPSFDYRLHAGPTTSHNAISLLAFLGAPPAVIETARATAEAQSPR